MESKGGSGSTSFRASLNDKYGPNSRWIRPGLVVSRTRGGGLQKSTKVLSFDSMEHSVVVDRSIWTPRDEAPPVVRARGVR